MSLKLTLRLIREGARSASLSQCLDRELNACREVLRAPDFYEGVRAAIIDKDRTPRWSLVHINAVTQDMIEPFFRPEHIKQMILSGTTRLDGHPIRKMNTSLGAVGNQTRNGTRPGEAAPSSQLASFDGEAASRTTQ